MNTSTWIKISDRKPTEADLPLIGGSYRFGIWSTSSVWDRVDGIDADRTHWISIPKAPANEPTRDEQDNALAEEALKAYQRDGVLIGERDMIKSGIRFERQFYRDLVALYTANEISIQETLKRVKERVEQ